MDRKEILDKDAECVLGRREEEYGSPEDNFGMIAQLWSRYLMRDVDPVDVANMMILLKVARIRSGNATDDSFIDIAGYAACGGEISAKRREKPEPESGTACMHEWEFIGVSTGGYEYRCRRCCMMQTLQMGGLKND